MKSPSLWLVFLPLCIACAASPSAPAPVSVPPSAAPPAASTAASPPVNEAASPRASEAPPLPDAAAADRDLVTRGLQRTDAKPSVPPPNWSDTRASMYILARTSKGQVALVGSGAQLHTGEQIELHVSVGRPSYVYLIQISPTDQATILYPAAGESEKMVPGIDYRMPTDPAVRFELDANVGTERLAFVVNEQPLATGDADVRALIEQLRATGRFASGGERAAPSQPAAGAAPEKARARTAPVTQAGPVHGTGGTRGFKRATAGTGRALDVQPDQAGVALAFFTFDHIP